MEANETFANGQKQWEQSDDNRTYFYKNGKIRATGIYKNGMMEGEWIFYRESGQLWQVGQFLNSAKNGRFVRYNRSDELEYDENFANDKIVKKK